MCFCLFEQWTDKERYICLLLCGPAWLFKFSSSSQYWTVWSHITHFADIMQASNIPSFVCLYQLPVYSLKRMQSNSVLEFSLANVVFRLSVTQSVLSPGQSWGDVEKFSHHYWGLPQCIPVVLHKSMVGVTTEKIQRNREHDHVQIEQKKCFECSR